MLYILAADHGSGAGAALLNAVVEPHGSAALWVADPHPRAPAFHRKLEAPDLVDRAAKDHSQTPDEALDGEHLALALFVNGGDRCGWIVTSAGMRGALLS